MGQYDAQQLCLNGHQITDSYYRAPSLRQPFCEKCGAKTIHKCPECSADIPGYYAVEGIIDCTSNRTPIPKFCKSCGTKFPWAPTEASDPVTKLDPADSVERICKRIPLVIRQLRMRHDNREAYDVGNEYDLQDLLHSLLNLFFDDVRAEEYTPSYAGKSTRMDFLLKDESIVIEAKMTRKGLGAKELGDELTIDFAHYKAHPSCKMLFCLVYDPEQRVQNPRGLEKDLSGQREGLQVKVFIVPQIAY